MARYERHRPEATLLYQLVETHYPTFLAVLHARGRTLPGYVQQEFAAYLQCGRLEHGFLRVRCTACHAGRLRQWVLSVPFPLRYLFATEPAAMGAVLGIVYRAIASHLVRKAGLSHATGRTGAVTLTQRFGSALNLNIHFHLLLLDGAYKLGGDAPRFCRVSPPTPVELEALLRRIVQRIKRVFRLDIEQCERCGGKVKVIASIEDPAVIAGILGHLEKAPPSAGIAAAHRPRGPPGQGWLELI